MKEFEIMCSHEGGLNCTQMHQIFYIIVSNGGRYNSGKYPGSYDIFVQDGDDIGEMEDPNAGHMVEKLPVIVEEYCRHDLSTDMLSVELAGSMGKAINYLLCVYSQEPDQSVITFKTSSDDVGDQEGFLKLASLAEELCKRMNINYAAYRGEYDEVDFPSQEDISSTHLQQVTYLSNELVAAIGRERVLSLPATEVRAHDDGGAFIIVSSDPSGAYEKLQHARSEFT